MVPLSYRGDRPGTCIQMSYTTQLSGSTFHSGELYNTTEWWYFHSCELNDITEWWYFHSSRELYNTTELAHDELSDVDFQDRLAQSRATRAMLTMLERRGILF